MNLETRGVTINGGDGVVLSGTLVAPMNRRPSPGALLLSGSGPLDRDSNTAGQRLDISSTLAAALGAVGIASLRFDKRGVAASSGDFVSTSFEGEISDAAAALKSLRGSDAIDPCRVGIIGHSVGATVAARLAATDTTVAFAVLLGCAASSGADVMGWQTERIASTLPGPTWILGRHFRRKQAQHLHRLATSGGDAIRIGKEDVPARWLREYRAHEPLADLAALNCPVLAITGGKDIQVNPADVDRIAAAVSGPCATLVPDDLTHILRSSSQEPSIARYSKLLQHPVDADLVETISNWTLDQTRRDPMSVDSDEQPS